MNTPISFEIKQLLYDKGWRYELGVDETGYRVEHSLAEQRWNEGGLTYVDITTVDVVMWLYEKHGIWISVEQNIYEKKFDYLITQRKTNSWYVKSNDELVFNSPTEAYEAAIEYTLNNLI